MVGLYCSRRIAYTTHTEVESMPQIYKCARIRVSLRQLASDEWPALPIGEQRYMVHAQEAGCGLEGFQSALGS